MRERRATFASVEASRSIGAGGTRILAGDVLPNLIAPIIVLATLLSSREKRWPLIYSANKKHLKNPHSLKVGQQLVIPRDYTEKQAVEAEKKAD